MKPKTFGANVSWGKVGKVSLNKSMILSNLAWTFQTKWENECVERRKGKTWHVLQQFNYSWKRGHVHRERLKQAILGGCTPRPHQLLSLHPSSTFPYNYALSTPSTIAAHLTESTTAGLTPIVSVKAYEIHEPMSFADNESSELGRVWGSDTKGKKMAAVVVVTLISLACMCLCCAWSNVQLKQDEVSDVHIV